VSGAPPGGDARERLSVAVAGMAALAPSGVPLRPAYVVALPGRVVGLK
jgi:hypothetical protein